MPYKDRARKLQYDRDYCKTLSARKRARARSHTHRFRVVRLAYLDSLRGGYSLLRRMAVRRKCAMEISFEEYRALVEGKPCWYCKIDLSKHCGHKLDRVDNELGYSIDNVVPCCADCNRIKGVLERWGYRLPKLIGLVHLVREGRYCPQGHPKSGKNLLITKRGDRMCLTCKRKSNREAMRKWRAKPDPRPEQ